jgi:hypothetical protein
MYVTFQKKPSSTGYSKFSVLNVTAGLYLLALPEKILMAITKETFVLS